MIRKYKPYFKKNFTFKNDSWHILKFGWKKAKLHEKQYNSKMRFASKNVYGGRWSGFNSDYDYDY